MQLAASTAQQLEEVWDEVGYNPEERASQLSDLLVKFRDLCDTKIAEERGVAETFRQTIADAKEELKRTGKALKSLVDPDLLKEGSNMTLTDKLDTLEAALEGLRSSAVAARTDLQETRDQLIEAHEALGLDMDPNYREIESDLTIERREVFHRKLDEMKDELKTRTSAVIQLIRDCQHLMRDLRIDATEEGATEMDKRIAGSLIRSKDGSFMMASKFQTDSCTGISSKALDELTSRVTELNAEKRHRRIRLEEMGVEISTLWEKLHVPEEEQRAFTDSVVGLSKDTIEKGENELKRLHALKNAMLGKLVLDARDMIVELWEETNTTEEQKKAFEPMYVKNEESFDDELLERHEEYVSVLQERLEQMKPILRVIERREEIIKERMEYEELQKDSERLKQRGAALTKQLMREEKMAKRIKHELPKLTMTLDDKLKEWRREHGEHFQIHGESYLEVMKRHDEEWQHYKENEQHLKLQKKQEERAQVEQRFAHGKSSFRPLAGKKKPLGDAKSRENVPRTDKS
jgi:Ase1/PRC1/MAP65 family protein